MVSTGSTTRKRALVVTVVHHPEDARIRHRQISALLDASWQVTYAAPFTAYGVEVSIALDQQGRLTTVDLPRALGRRRLRALRAARQLLAARGPDHDVVLLHDAELVLAAHRLELPPVVWDVHEDTAAAVSLKPWLPAPARRVAAGSVLRLERLAERHHHLLLAEDSYADRFQGGHPVVPNTTTVPETVPPPDDDRVVYVGHLTAARGVHELIALGRLLAGRITVELIGHADTDAAGALAASGDAVDWLGFLPYDEAMARVAGARAGLSLLHDQPNYRHSRPTKVIEYLAHGVPVVTTPLPLAARLATDTGAGIVVPFESAARATADAILGPLADPGQRLKMGFLGHHHAAAHYDWSTKKHDFVRELARLVE
jgi:glycosyltransferase involved in cell wall biosynthesis